MASKIKKAPKEPKKFNFYTMECGVLYKHPDFETYYMKSLQGSIVWIEPNNRLSDYAKFTHAEYFGASAPLTYILAPVGTSIEFTQDACILS